MDELIKQIQQRTGIDEAQARGAADTVIGFLKERLPAPVAGQLDSLLGGGGTGAAGSSPLESLGDLGKLGG